MIGEERRIRYGIVNFLFTPILLISLWDKGCGVTPVTHIMVEKNHSSLHYYIIHSLEMNVLRPGRVCGN